MSRSWAKGSTYRWRRIRKDVLLANQAENKGRCQLNVGVHCARHDRRCPGVCTGLATQGHHVKGKAHGDDPRYVIAVCRACNLHVGNPRNISPEPRPISKW